MGVENRPVTACHWAKGNYRGRHGWKKTDAVTPFGAHTAVYVPDISRENDPKETGRSIFDKRGEDVVHYATKTSSVSAHEDVDASSARSATTASSSGNPPLLSVSSWRGGNTVRAAVPASLDHYRTSSAADFKNPADQVDAIATAGATNASKDKKLPAYFNSSVFYTEDTVSGRISYVAE